MIILKCKKTEETCQRLRDLMPRSLRDKKIALNMGNSELKKDYSKYLLLNNPEAVKRAVNKKKMFEVLEDNRINCLKYMDIEYLKGKAEAVVSLFSGKEIVLRDGGDIKVITASELRELYNPKWKYATIKENKLLEYRFVVFRDKILRAMVKANAKGDFRVKQENSEFRMIDITKIPEDAINNIIKSVKCLGLDLAGVDVLLNMKDEFKIIEVNSGMALSPRSIKRLYKAVKEI